MEKHTRLSATTLPLLLALVTGVPAATAPQATLVNDTFVGRVAGRALIAIVTGDRGVMAYLCDNDETGTWFASAGRTGNDLQLISTNGLETLSADVRHRIAHGWVSYKGRHLPFIALRAEQDAGLYRTKGDVNGTGYLGGWIVLNNGRQVGSIGVGGVTSTAPPLSTTSLAVQSAGSQLVVGKVSTPFAEQLIVLDRNGNGLNLSATVRTALISGAIGTYRWPASSDDAMVMLDATAALAGGLELHDSSGNTLTGPILLRGGLTLINQNTHVTTALTDARQLLRALDSNQDGRVDANDPASAYLRVFTDANANGTVNSGEVSSLASAGVAVVGTPGSGASSDAFGNIIDIGTFTRTSLSVGVSAQVTFKLF